MIPVRRPYHVISRLVLSRWGLDRALAAGAAFFSAGVKRVERTPGGWRIEDSSGDVHMARWLVGADGATSRIRSSVSPNLRPELAPTRVIYPTGGAPPGRAVFQFLPRAQGYLWDFPRPEHQSVGIGVEPGTFQREALDTALSQYQVAETGDTTESAKPHGAVIATSAWIAGRIEDLGSRDYALLGDAGGLADPATGEGIDYALRSATLAARAFSPEHGFREYPMAVRRTFQHEMRRAKLIRRWLYHPSVAERLVRFARRSPRGALLFMSFSDAINEHGSLSGALWRTLRGQPGDLGTARAVCECPDGSGASPPP
jgi:flavin-dependent dehydrogenase